MIHKFLADKRVDSGLTQRELSKKLGYISAQYVSNWERGVVGPPLKNLKRLASCLKLNQQDKQKMYDMLMSTYSKNLKKVLTLLVLFMLGGCGSSAAPTACELGQLDGVFDDVGGVSFGRISISSCQFVYGIGDSCIMKGAMKTDGKKMSVDFSSVSDGCGETPDKLSCTYSIDVDTLKIKCPSYGLDVTMERNE